MAPNEEPVSKYVVHVLVSFNMENPIGSVRMYHPGAATVISGTERYRERPDDPTYRNGKIGMRMVTIRK